MNFRKATIEDLDILVATRIEVLRAANRLDASIDMMGIIILIIEKFLENNEFIIEIIIVNTIINPKRKP